MKNRKAFKLLNSKLETLDGALKEQDDDDMVRILNCRLTQAEYDNAVDADRVMDDNKGECDFNLKNMKSTLGVNSRAYVRGKA